MAAIALGGISIEQASRAVAGQMPQSLTVSTSPGSMADEVRYQVQIGTGGEIAAFGFQYALPLWPTAEPVFGSPVRVDSVELSSDGSIRPAAQGLPGRPVQRIINQCTRSKAASFPQRIWIEVPANSVSVLNLLVKGTYPAWPGTKYGLSFSTFAFDEPSAELVPLASENVQRFMPKGTHIELRAKKQHGKAPTTPEIVGRTSPPLRQARIALKVVRPSPSGAVGLRSWARSPWPTLSLGAVQTDSRGHFRVEPQRIPEKGPFAVIARSEARAMRAADWNCGAFFNIK
jgi:hypothetical protein